MEIIIIKLKTIQIITEEESKFFDFFLNYLFQLIG